MIMAFQSDKEREENIKLLEDATRQELSMTREEINTLNRIADELEEAIAQSVHERVKRHGRAA